MADPTPPKYEVIGHEDKKRLLEIIYQAPIPRALTDPMVKILTTGMARLPAKLEKAFEASVRAAGHKIVEPPAEKVTTPKNGTPKKRPRPRVTKAKKGSCPRAK
jgi:hypothetical protein